jgi:cytosine/adenosine deaminase-related metal-dependent hydrolase
MPEPIDHYDAQDIAQMIPAPAARAFIRTGRITPGLRAAVVLYDTDRQATQLREYVEARVDAGLLDPPKDWPA